MLYLIIGFIGRKWSSKHAGVILSRENRGTPATVLVDMFGISWSIWRLPSGKPQYRELQKSICDGTKPWTSFFLNLFINIPRHAWYVYQITYHFSFGFSNLSNHSNIFIKYNPMTNDRFRQLHCWFITVDFKHLALSSSHASNFL